MKKNPSQIIEPDNIKNANKVVNIDNYITFKKYLYIKDKSNNIDYIDKPLLTVTESRIEIERQLEAERKQQEYEEYFNYLAQTNSRDVYVRESSYERYNLSEKENNITQTNTYYYGHCTWYVANIISIPNDWGNAGDWLTNAQIAGYPTGHTPQIQSIIVTSESYWGHVGIVEEIKEETIIISEMNYVGWGIVNSREISKQSPIIKGYIY